MASKRTKKKPVAKNARRAPRRRLSPPIDRHQTTSALGENGDEFRATFNMTSVGFCQAEPLTGCLLNMNRAFCQMVGYEEGELLNRPFAEITHPDDRAVNLEGYHRLIRGEASEYRGTKRYIRKDGRVIWADVTVNLVRDLDGRPWRTVALIQDITERKQAEEQLRESEERLRHVLEKTNTAVWDWDIPSGKVFWTPQHFTMLGYEPGSVEPSYANWAARVHPEDLASTEAAVREAMASHREYRHQFRTRWPNGTIRWIEAHGRYAYQPDGHCARMVGLMSDITDRKRVEEALQASDALMRANLEAMTTLQRLGMLSGQGMVLEPLLAEVVDAAIRISDADFGNIQLLDPESGHLKIAAQRGFPDWWVEYWNRVSKGQGACGTALARGQRVVIEDVARSPIYTDEEARNTLLEVGVCTVISIPLVGWSGKLVGVFSTHYKARHRPDLQTLQLLDLLARQAADIIEQLETSAALKAREAFIGDVLDSLTAHVCVLDGQGVIIRTNKPWQQFTRANADPTRIIGTVGDNYLDVCRRAIANGDATARPILSGLEAVLAGKQAMFSTEYPCDSPDEARWFLLRVSPLKSSQGVVISHVDITHRKQAEASQLTKQQELERSQEKLEALTSQLLRAQDNERSRIARELHDDYVQRLAALALDLHQLARSPLNPVESAKAVITQFAQSVEGLTRELQQVTHQLHPSTLNHLGLEATLHDHVEEFARRTGLQTDVQVHEVPAKLPEAHTLCFFRVLQECLQNVRKHAHASRVLVRLIGTGRGVGLCVHDDGRGFDAAQDESGGRRGLGLISLEERLEALNGTFRLRTKPGDGTEVHAWLPLEPEQVSAERGGEQ